MMTVLLSLPARFQRIQHRADVPIHVDHAVNVVIDVIVPHVPALHGDLTVGPLSHKIL